MRPAHCTHSEPTAVDCPKAMEALASHHDAWPRSRDLREQFIRQFLGSNPDAHARHALIETLSLLTADDVSRAISAPGTLAEPRRRALDDFHARLLTWLSGVERLADEAITERACRRAMSGAAPIAEAAVTS